MVEVSFPVYAPLGEIKKIHIGHDNVGDLGVGLVYINVNMRTAQCVVYRWYLEHVDVITPDQER